LFQNLDLLAREGDVQYVHPFLDAAFLHALSRLGGPTGFASRTEAMRTLFHDVLPEAVLARTTKARFNSAAVGRHSAEFIAGWTGTGVDLDLVDPTALAASWRAPAVDARTLILLQAAWLASRDA
jgi:asparagine synthase (glutamine-hydrolysing)